MEESRRVDALATRWPSCFYGEWHSHRIHAKEITQAFDERLLPAAAFISSFVEREHRLPTDQEMEDAGWHMGDTDGHGPFDRIKMYRERPNWADSWGVQGKDFLVETQVPDWFLRYQSWDKKRIEDEME